MIRSSFLCFILLLAISFSTAAQTFAPAFNGVSKKKTTYITLKSGEEKEVVIKKLFFKKGLIDDLKVIEAGSEAKVKINPEDIEFMYLQVHLLS